MILVIGVGRTGTSLVSRVLEENLGVDMGGPGEGGHYEDEEFRQLFIRFLNREISEEGWVEGALEIAETKTEPWGVKYPPHSEFPFTVLQAFPDAPVIWADRDAWDTYQSWLRNFTLEPDEAWARIHYRYWSIALNLLNRSHVTIDTTERLDEDQLASALGEGIELLAPGTLAI